MKLAVVGPTHPYKGGIAQHTTELAHRLAAAGVDVAVWSWRRQYPARLYPGEQRVPGSVPESPPFPATTEPLSWDSPPGWWAAGRRARGLDGLLLTWTTPVQAPAYLGLLAGLGARHRSAGPGGVSVVGICHNVLPHEPRAVDPPLTRAVLGRCAGLVVHSAEQAAVAAGVAPRARVGVAALPPPALPPAALPATPVTRPSRNSLTLLLFGIVRPYKGIDVLLRALAHPEVPPAVRLIVAGEFWTPLAEIQGLVDELGLRSRVELRPGYVEAADLAALFAEADAAVLPYRSGTSSIVPDLAQRHGLPVVATRVGTLAQSVRDGVDGFLVPPADPPALAAALAQLATGETLARLRAGVRPVDRDEQWAAYVDTVFDVLGRGRP